ncbi:MAG TPA: hypothetical protein VL221_03695 [Bacteroidota bacterium]|nr:hypothetical protein [Bacteroidota bacterium]
MKRTVISLCALVFLGTALTSAQGKFSGYIFGDYFYNIAKDTAFSKLSRTVVPGSKDFQAFQIRRFYLTYDNDISEKFTAKLRLEGNAIASEGGSSSTASRLTGSSLSQVFLKDAYLKWKSVFTGSDLYIGIQPTTAFEISEGAWGFRSLEKTIMDLRGIISSRDMGVALRGKFDEAGMFQYWAMVGNNSGNDDATNRHKRASLNIEVKPAKNVIIDVNGDFIARADINDPASTTAPKATKSNNIMTYSGFVAYNDPQLVTIGVEAFMQSTQNGEVDPTDATGHTLKSLSQFGLSVFGYYWFEPELGIVARYDIYNPVTDSNYPAVPTGTNPTGTATYAYSLSRNYLIAGISYRPDKNVQIIPNIQLESYQTPRNVASPSTIDASVTGRVTFYWVFL